MPRFDHLNMRKDITEMGNDAAGNKQNDLGTWGTSGERLEESRSVSFGKILKGELSGRAKIVKGIERAGAAGLFKLV